VGALPHPLLGAPAVAGEVNVPTRRRGFLGGALPLRALLTALAACGGERPPTVTVTDSAGVRLTVSADGPRVFAEVDTPAVLSLGGADVAGPAQFSNVQGVHLDPGGNVWVVDGQSAEVRLFHADGSPWKTVGRRGEGPGEFLRPRMLGSFRGDSVAIWDDGNGRLTVLDGDGDVGRMTTVRTGDDLPPKAFRVFDDGTLLARVQRVIPAGALEPGTLLPDTAIFVRVDVTDMGTVPQGGAPGPKWLWTGHSQIPIPFTENPGFDVVGKELHVVSGPDFRIRVFAGGRLREIYGTTRPPLPVTSKEEQAYTDVTTSYWGDAPQAREYLSVLHRPGRPQLLPGYRQVLAADDGNVWAALYASDGSDVYGPDRVWRGRVATPAGFVATHITGSRMAGVWRDDLGVEYVRVYRIRAAPPDLK
jgi:hypothetical protein